MDPVARRRALAWVLGVIAAAAAVTGLTRRALAAWREEWFEPRGLARGFVEVGDALAEGWGVLGVALVLAIGLAPGLAVRRVGVARRWFGLALVEAVLLVPTCWAALEVVRFYDAGCMCGVCLPPRWRAGSTPLLFALHGLVLVHAGVGLALVDAGFELWTGRRSARRGPFVVEAARAAVLAAGPAVVVAIACAAVADALRPDGGLLVIPFPLAAGGTGALAVHALALRAQFRRAEAAELITETATSAAT